MAKGFKVSKKMLMIGGVVLVAIVAVVIMFRSSEEFQVNSSSNNPNAGSIYVNTSSGDVKPPAPPTSGDPMQFYTMINEMKRTMNISNNAKMAANTVNDKIWEQQKEVMLKYNADKRRKDGLDFFSKQLAIAKNNKKRLPLSELLSDYYDVQIPKWVYFEKRMEFLGAFATDSSLLADRYNDKNNWLFKSAETSALQREADTAQKMKMTLLKSYYNSDILPNIVKELLTAEANIIAAGGTFPNGALYLTLSPMKM